jgi:hypothetical protein
VKDKVVNVDYPLWKADIGLKLMLRELNTTLTIHMQSTLVVGLLTGTLVVTVSNHRWDIDCPVQGCCNRSIKERWKEEALKLRGGKEYGHGNKEVERKIREYKIIFTMSKEVGKGLETSRTTMWRKA